MENKDDQTLEGGVEETKDLNEETTEAPTEEKEETSSDPLDAIVDDKDRDEAKRARAELRRGDRKEEPEKETPKAEFLTKGDFYKANEKKGYQLLLDSDKDFVAENKDGIEKLFVSRNGKDTPEEVFEDYKDALMLFKAKNPPKVEDGSSELSETGGGGGGSSAKPTEGKTEQPPAFNMPNQPYDKKTGKVLWYKDEREKSE